MESSLNNSTHEESSKIPNEEDSNVPSGRLSGIARNTLQPPLLSRQKFNENFQIEEKESNKNNETLPIKNTISVFNFKIVLIGNVSVGKSSIIKRFIHNEFSKTYFCTVGTELSQKTLLIGENKKASLYIWDTCGQEKFRTVTRQYYRDTQAIILVFDLTNKKSFNDLESWLDEAVNYITNTKCLFFLLGNKSDEKEKIVVENNEIKNFLRKNQKIKKYFEISAFNGHNVDLAFDKISQHLVIRFSGEEINKNMNNYKKNLQLEDGNNSKKKGVRCC